MVTFSDLQVKLSTVTHNDIMGWLSSSTRSLTYETIFRDALFFTIKTGVSSKLTDAPWHSTWGGTRRALRYLKTPTDMIIKYTKQASIKINILPLLDYPTSLSVKWLSNFNLLIFTNNDNLDPSWNKYVHLASLAGYPPMKDREFTDDPHLWLSENSTNSYTPSWWADRFTDTYMNEPHKPVERLSLLEFTKSRWLWVTSGASSVSSALLDGEKVKTKFGAAVSLSDDELLDLVYSEQRPIGIFIKPDEAGYKRRLIANVPLGGYIIAAYIRYFLEGRVANPSYINLSPDLESDKEVIGEIRRGDSTIMPLDESAYDYNFTKETWDGFILFLKTMGLPADALEAFISLRNSKWIFGDEEGDWKAGMPSGLALTSYLNSWVNYIKQMEITPARINLAAGDDALIIGKDLLPLSVIEKKYAAFGAVVNTYKNWESHAYGEFLKRVYSANGVTGYPARIFSSLLWALNVSYVTPDQKIFELTELWKQYYDRLSLPLDEREVAIDITSAISHKVQGFSLKTAIKWLHSPRVSGGFGCLPYNNTKFRWTHILNKQKEYTKVIMDLPKVPFYNSKGSTLSVLEEPAFHGSSNYKLGEPFRLPPVSSITEWENRLNGLDNPFSGRFSTMVQGIIPLPNVNGISTAILSKMAKAWGYNVFPNLVNNSARTEARLVSASIALALRAVDYMAQNKYVSLL